ncbi:molybdopterin-guanine dinucleotide biosynthesis protein MobA [Novosphingobium barchaimii LL02]|uniref:Molybdopterin-guanine dinucleotide biosynthesis protein MobA n=1 Tax=Novosphingobium barchaimii LL02 TaxID=1114963 RepID=A0A0J8AHM9_9SPHN|nr:nucleotidyltransferase family protein [Novosphingobium barchaimii]KMS54320.1 molybdopterin-guanine dinucleotide biosynthesis protein MobA [Novosphingobium barchaimii LL02]
MTADGCLPGDWFAAIVLAAGHAVRFGSDKLAAPLDGAPLLTHAIRAARAAPVAKVVVVTRPGLTLEPCPGKPAVEVVRLASTALSDTLKTGVAAVSGAKGAFVFLGDMPRIPHGLAASLAAAIGPAYAAMPRQGGRPGHPVLLSSRAFADICALTGDEGAGRLLRRRDDVTFVDCTDPAIHFDVDRPDDLARAAGPS